MEREGAELEAALGLMLLRRGYPDVGYGHVVRQIGHPVRRVFLLGAGILSFTPAVHFH